MTELPTPPSLADASWLNAPAPQAVMRFLADGGYEGRFVGGVVRNALIGQPITDIDIATTAPPEAVIRLGKAAGLQVIETGIEHGTVTVISDHHTIEVTTLRRDVTTDGRRATVAFTDDWAADARRRDFTINALYCDARGRVHDPLGGYGDLVQRRVRFVGAAAERIREDYLRLLRFFRFSGTYGMGALDAEGLAAATRGRDGLKALSAERIRQEMTRILVAPRGVEMVTAMQDHGVLAHVMPAAPRPGLLATAVAVERAMGGAPDAMERLAALAVETAEDADRLGLAWRLSREERDRLRLAVRPEARLALPPDERAARALLYRNGTESFRRLIALAWTRRLADGQKEPELAAWLDVVALPARWTPPRLPVGGEDALALGLGGAEVGQALRAAETWWIEKDFGPGREDVHARLSEFARRMTARA